MVNYSEKQMTKLSHTNYTICSNLDVFIIAATSEATLALAWSPYDPNLLITGQAQKFLRVFDLRGGYTTFKLIRSQQNDRKPIYFYM